MNILLNDRPRAIVDGTSLHALLTELAVADRRGVAVALNDTVVPRAEWASCALRPDDRVLLIQAAQGG